MNCRDIMSTDVHRIRPDATVAEAARLMRSHTLGWLVVCLEDARPLGVVTDGDITSRVVAQGRSPKHTSVGEIMSSPVQGVLLDNPAELASEVMGRLGLRRLPVLGDDGQVDGVVSQVDLVTKGPPALGRAVARDIRARGQARGASLPKPRRPHRDPRTPAADDEPQPEALLEPTITNPARAEVDNVAAGGINPLKEFPS
jgi:CBS domain-containing protein